MRDEIARLLRRAVRRQIARRRAQYHFDCIQFLGDQARIRQLAEADRQIDALFDQIDIVVVQAQVDRDVGIGDEIIGDRRRQLMRAERHRRGHPEQAARRGLKVAGGAFGVFHFIEDAQAALIVILPDLGGADAARRAIEQPHAEPFLERADMFAHHGRRHIEVPSRRGKARGLDDFGEYRHSDEAIQARTSQGQSRPDVSPLGPPARTRAFSTPRDLSELLVRNLSDHAAALIAALRGLHDVMAITADYSPQRPRNCSTTSRRCGRARCSAT